MNSTSLPVRKAGIHDEFIRSILSDKSIAVDYFKNYLPDAISKQFNFSTLTQLLDTYLSEDLKKTMSDIVYSCQRKGTKKTVKVSLLIEHKSYPDKYTPVQIGGYIFSALQKQVVNNEPLSIVILYCFTMVRENGSIVHWPTFLEKLMLTGNNTYPIFNTCIII